MFYINKSKTHEYITSMNQRLLISKFISTSDEICNLDKMSKKSKPSGYISFRSTHFIIFFALG